MAGSNESWLRGKVESPEKAPPRGKRRSAPARDQIASVAPEASPDTNPACGQKPDNARAPQSRTPRRATAAGSLATPSPARSTRPRFARIRAGRRPTGPAIAHPTSVPPRCPVNSRGVRREPWPEMWALSEARSEKAFLRGRAAERTPRPGGTARMFRRKTGFQVAARNRSHRD